jgi:two-component system response regulator YesN
MKAAFDEANMAAYQFFTLCKSDVYTYNECEISELDNWLLALEKFIHKKDIVSVENTINQISQLFKTQLYNIKIAYKVFNLIMSFTYRYSAECKDMVLDGYEQLIDLFKDIDGMFEYLKEFVVRQIGGHQELYENIENSKIKAILEYINSNFYKHISVQGLSEKFFISPNYISRLFSKELGESFTDYLIKIRINYACELLKSSNYTIQQISEKSGFSDYFYFTRVFKKRMGKTPSQMRIEKK